MPVALVDRRVHARNGVAFLPVYVSALGDMVGWYVSPVDGDVTVYAIPGTDFYAWTTEQNYIGYYANAVYANYVEQGQVRSALDYAVVFIGGPLESQMHFRVWAESYQKSVTYVETDERGRDVYQVKSPMSFQVLLLRAAYLMCLVDLV